MADSRDLGRSTCMQHVAMCLWLRLCIVVHGDGACTGPCGGAQFLLGGWGGGVGGVVTFLC